MRIKTAELLLTLNYDGKYCVIASDMPNAHKQPHKMWCNRWRNYWGRKLDAIIRWFMPVNENPAKTMQHKAAIILSIPNGKRNEHRFKSDSNQDKKTPTALAKNFTWSPGSGNYSHYCIFLIASRHRLHSTQFNCCTYHCCDRFQMLHGIHTALNRFVFIHSIVFACF